MSDDLDDLDGEFLSQGRFAVLHHQVGTRFTRTQRDHFDWLFEAGAGLLTWATELDVHASVGWSPEQGFPVQQPVVLPATRLPNHRKVYLDYEGPISGDRGRVVRWIRGEYHLVPTQASDADVEKAEVLLDLQCERTSASVQLPVQGASRVRQSLRIQRIRDVGFSADSSIAWRLSLSRK